MATADEIAVKLGIDTTQFKAALRSANAELKTFKEGAGGVGEALDHLNENTERLQHRLLSGLFGYEALRRVIEWGVESVKQAQEVRDEFEKLGKSIDEKTALLADLGDAFTATKQLAVDGVGTVISWFAKAGDSYAYWINRLRGFSAEEQAANDKTARAAAAQEKQRDDAIKKHAQDGEKAIEIEKKIQAAKDKNALTNLSLAKQEEELRARQLKQEEELAAIVGDGDTAHLLRAQKQLEITQTQGEIDAKIAEQERQWNTEADQRAKEQVSLHKQLHDLKFASLTPEQQLVQLQQEQLALVAKIAAEKRKHLATLPDEVELQKNLNEQEKIRAQLTKETAQSEAEIAAAKKKALEDEKNSHASIVGVRGGKQFNDASDAALRQIIANNRNEANVDRYRGLTNIDVAGNSSIGSLLEASRLEQEAINAQKELDFRRNFKSTVSLLGESGARARFAGDPLQFDRVLEQFTKTQDKSTTLLQSLDDRLQTAGFGRR